MPVTRAHHHRESRILLSLTGGTLSATCQSQNPGSQTAIISTCVSVRYGYPWKFGQAASLLGVTTMLPNPISAVGVSANEN